jgi:protein-S-isoprenylcysteine O-methyltransferase Ste14
MTDLVLVGVLTTLWCIFHSFFVSHFWRGQVQRHFPRYHVFSRLVYVVFSTLSLLILMLWIRTLPTATLFTWTGGWAWIRLLGLAEAGFLFWLGIRSYDNRSFLGLTQAVNYLKGVSASEPAFRTGGILAVIRHPWYTGTLILLVFCLPYTDVNLVWRLVFLAYTLIGTQLEERKMLRDLGETYAAYRREVPRFFPLTRTRGRRQHPLPKDQDPDKPE